MEGNFMITYRLSSQKTISPFLCHYRIFFPLIFSLLLLLSNMLHAVIYINNIEDLQKIGNDPEYPIHEEYELTGNIDASDTINWNEGAGFIPIGTTANPFLGKLDGKNYTISGLYVNRPSESHIGLFGVVASSAEIKDLNIENADISGTYNTGILIGYNLGTITNVHVSGRVSGTTTIGVLIGDNRGPVSNCSATGAIEGNDYIGGLIGWFTSTTEAVSQCYATSYVKSNGAYAGGLIGIVTSGTVNNCYASGHVAGYNCIGGVDWVYKQRNRVQFLLHRCS